MTKTINLGVLGIDHGHIFDMLDEMLKEGCSCNYFWTEGSPLTLDKFSKKYPQIKRVDNKSYILNDDTIDLILISSIPKDRANLSIDAMKAGKDVMVDKPGCTTLEQLNNLKQIVKETGKIWSINFSERFHVAAVAKAEMLVDEGKIGKVKQTIGTGPHRQGNYVADTDLVEELESNNQIAFKYKYQNPNGSIKGIAGIFNQEKNVLGMMPHPERASEAVLGSSGGYKIFKSILES